MTTTIIHIGVYYEHIVLIGLKIVKYEMLITSSSVQVNTKGKKNCKHANYEIDN